MDPISAISLASNIVQFVDFSWKLLSGTQAIYKSATGLTADHEDLDLIADDLVSIDSGLTATTAPGAIPDSLRLLSARCKELSSEILGILQSLRVKSSHRRWESFGQALRSVWKKEEIESLAKRLEALRSEMQLRVSLIICAETSDIYTAMHTLMAKNQRLAMDGTHQLGDQLQDVQTALAELKLEVQQSKEKAQPRVERLDSPSPESIAYLPLDTGSMQSLSLRLSQLARTASMAAFDHELLSSLWFKTIDDRKANVAKSFQKTFSWILDPLSPSQFEPWLRKHNGIYWITGKPGSGKSTLMKFLIDHPKAEELLAYWAAGKKLIEGLIRSLLFEVLHRCPELISIVCAAKARTFRPYESNVSPWTLTELHEAIAELKNQSGSKARFCFFIDGLDEYDGEPGQIIEVLESLAKWKDVKLCISSRPWNEFIDAFGRPHDPQLALETLTRSDIKSYVQETLGRNERFKNLVLRDSRTQQLVNQIVGRAQGVFLWVVLVVKSLLTGLKNADRVSDLQVRVQEFPPTLEEYFSHILRSIEPFYRQQTARTFTVALAADGPLALTTYSFLDEEDAESSTPLKSEQQVKDQLMLRQDDMKRRLNGRSKGLLEINVGAEPDFTGPLAAFYDPKVDFLHRTARDFLYTRTMQQMLSENRGQEFEPRVALIRAFYAQVQVISKAGCSTHLARDIRMRHLENIACYSRALEMEQSDVHFPVLDNIAVNKSYGSEFLTVCATMRNLQYTEHFLEQPLRVKQSLRDEMLDAMFKHAAEDERGHSDWLSMISLLLDHGASPNARSSSKSLSIWGGFVKDIHQQSDTEISAVQLSAAKMLLAHNAKLDYRITTAQRTVVPQLSGRAGDLHKREFIQQEYKTAGKILEDALEPEAFRRLINESRSWKKSKALRNNSSGNNNALQKLGVGVKKLFT